MSETLFHFSFPIARSGILRGKLVEDVIELIVIGTSDSTGGVIA